MSDSNAPQNESEQSVPIKKVGPYDPKNSTSSSSSPGTSPFPSNATPTSTPTPNGFGQAKNFEGGKFMEEKYTPKPSAQVGTTDVRDTYSGKTPTSASTRRQVIMRNGVPYHIHPGYPSTAKTLAEADYHPVSQKHRGEGGKDITEQLHVMGGLGKDGMGGMKLGIGDAIRADIASKGKGKVAASIISAVAMTGMDAVPNVFNSMFNLADAVMSGNPMTMASSIAGESIDVFSGIADNYIKLQDKYRIPSNADESMLTQTILGRAFKGQVDAYNEGYGHAMNSSNTYLDLAADMSIYVTADGKSLYEQYAGTTDVPLTKADMDDMLRKRKAYLTANASMLATFGTYSKLHTDALTEMGYGSLKAYADGIGARDRDYLDAMSDLISDNKVYAIDSNGFIDKSSWVDASTMKQSDIDKYKIALQVGHKTSSEQLDVIKNKVKASYQRDLAEQKRIKAEEKEFNTRVKAIQDARKRSNIMDGGMHVNAVYAIGMDTTIDGRFNPMHSNTLKTAISRLQELIDKQPELRAAATAAGITDPRERKLYGAYSDDDVRDAEDKIKEWSLMAADLDAKHLKARTDAEAHKVSEMGTLDRLKHKIKKLDADGLPDNDDALRKYLGKLQFELATWDNRGAKNAKSVVSDAELDKGVRDFATQVATVMGDPSKANDIYNRLTTSQSNSLYLKDLKNIIRSEGIADAGAKADYAEINNEATKADIKRRLAALTLTYSNTNKISGIDSTQFKHAMDELLKQYDEMSKGCDDASANSELYSSNKYNKLRDKISDMTTAVKNGSKIMPSDYAVPVGSYNYVKGENRADLLNKIVDEAKKPDGDFYYGGQRISDEEMSNLFGNGKNSITGFKNRERMDRILTDKMNILGVTTDVSNPANRFLAISALHTGDSPFEFKTNGKESNRKDISGAIKRELRVYDKYINDNYGGNPNAIRDDDALAFAMESHIQYLASKLALNESMRSKGLTDPQKDDILEYSDIVDDQAMKSMLNLSYDSNNKDFGAGRRRKDNASVEKDMEWARKLSTSEMDAEEAIRHYQDANAAALDSARGFKDSIYNVASAVGANHNPMISDTDWGMDSASYGSFFGVSTPSMSPSSIAQTIKDDYGFDINNGMDQMAVMILKRAGIESFSELTERGSAGYSSVLKRLDKIMKDYEGEGDYTDNKQVEALVKSTIVARNTVMAMEARQAMISKLSENGLEWIGNDPASKSKLMDESEKRFNELFKIAKETHWTSNMKGTLDNYSSIEKIDKDGAMALAGSSIVYGALGVSASLNQGSPNSVLHNAKMNLIADYIRKNPLDSKGLSNNLINAYNEEVSAGNTAYLTLSGALGAYQTGKANIRGQISTPIGLFNTAMEFLKGNPRGAVTSRAKKIWEEKDSNNLLNLKEWNDTNSLQNAPGSLHIVDIGVAFIPIKDANGDVIIDPQTGQACVNTVFTPIAQSQNGLQFIMTSKMEDVNDDMDFWKDLYDIDGIPKTTITGKNPVNRLHKSAKVTAEPSNYMVNGFRMLIKTYKVDNIGCKILNNLPYPCGIKGGISYYLVNNTKDAVTVTAYGTKYVSRMHGVIDCGKSLQTIGGERAFVTLPWEDIKIVPPCLFYGVLDVYIPGKPDGFNDPRIIEETAKTVPSRDDAENAVKIIRDFGGFYDSADIEADNLAKSIRNIIMRAYAQVGAYGKWVFDQARSKAQSLPALTLDNYYVVSRAAFRMAMEIGIGVFNSREAWHLVKGIKSNALLAISANPFMLYRKDYASSRPEVDAIAYIGNGPDKGERELHVKDMLMLIGLMASCEPEKYPPYVPLFYEDMDPQWSNAADYWYIIVHKRNDSVIGE